MAANTGTYLDTPAHRYRDGEDLSVLSLDRMVDLDGVVARVRQRPAAGGRAIDESDLVSALGGIPPVGRAVLIETGHSDAVGNTRVLRRPSLSDRRRRRIPGRPRSRPWSGSTR